MVLPPSTLLRKVCTLNVLFFFALATTRLPQLLPLDDI